MRVILAAIFLLLFAGAAGATCSPPFNVKDASSSTVPFSTVQLPDGNCGSNQAPNEWYGGTSNNGLFASALTLESTELNSLTNGSLAASTVGGTSGLFTNSNTGQARLGEVFFNAGTAGASCAAGGNISGWFLQSYNGSTFEATATAPARAPDFLVPLPATTLNAAFKANGPVLIPALNFKVLIQNNCGTSGTLAASANTIILAPLATQN